jgi:hypothetical protein
MLFLEMCHIFVGVTGMESFGYENITCKTKTKRALREEKLLTRSKSLKKPLIYYQQLILYDELFIARGNFFK